jgi:hypothetical protein
MRIVGTAASAAPSFAPMNPEDQHTTNAAEIAASDQAGDVFGIPVGLLKSATIPVGLSRRYTCCDG